MQLCLHWTNGFHYSQRNFLSFRLLNSHIQIYFFPDYFVCIRFCRSRLIRCDFAMAYLVTTVSVCISYGHWQCLLLLLLLLLFQYTCLFHPFSHAVCNVHTIFLHFFFFVWFQIISILDHALHHHMKNTNTWIHLYDTHSSKLHHSTCSLRSESTLQPNAKAGELAKLLH